MQVLDRTTQLLKRFEQHQPDRYNHETAWRDNTLLFQPFRGDVTTEVVGGEDRVLSVLDGTGMRAAARFTNFLRATIIPANTEWVRYRTSRDLMRSSEVREAMDLTSERVLEELSNSNFYIAASQAIRDLAVYGNACFLVQEDTPLINSEGVAFGGLLFSSVPMWRVWWSTGNGGRIIMVIREFEMPAIDAYRWFDGNPGTTASRLLEAGRHMEKVKYLQFVFPNEDFIPGGLRYDQKRWSSVWIEPGQREEIKVGGFDVNPYVTPRWAVADGEDYGMGPGHLARPDMMSLNELKAQILDSASRDLSPPLITENDSMTMLDDGPNGQIVMRRPQAFKPEYLNSGARYNEANNIRLEDQAGILKAFEADNLEQPETQPRSAEESRRLREQALVNMASAADSISDEFLTPALGVVLHLMERSGMLPELTALGESLGGSVRIQPIFQSPFFTAQKRASVDKIRDWIRDRSDRFSLTQDPVHFEDFDWTEINQFEAESLDLPQRLRLTNAEIQEQREAKARANAQQRATELVERLGKVPGIGANA